MIDGTTPTAEREQKIADFANGSIEVIVNVNISPKDLIALISSLFSWHDQPSLSRFIFSKWEEVFAYRKGKRPRLYWIM